MKLFWPDNENFNVERVARVVPLKRFLFILRHIHLNDNTKMPKMGSVHYDKLYKGRPLVTYLRKKNQNYIYHLEIYR